MNSINKSNYRLVPCIESCKSDQSLSVSNCAKKIVDSTIINAVEEIEETCDCVVDYSCQGCESDGLENDDSTSEKIVNCLTFDTVEEIGENYDCVIDKDCPGCEAKYSCEIPQKDSSTTEKTVKSSILGADEKFEEYYDCTIDKNCPGCETKNSDGFLQNDLSTTSETFVNCMTFGADEDIGNNNDCKKCAGCEIKNSLGDCQNDRPSTEIIVECEIIDVEQEIEESYDCIVNNGCPGCQTRDFQGNQQNDWPISEKMSAKDGLKCIKKMMQEWKNYEAMRGWKFYAEFIGMASDGASDFYNYQVRWSFPTPAYPEPQVTVSVFFTVEAPRKKQRKCPVDITYVFEGNQFAHRPKMPFRPKWIYDVLDTKTMIFKSFKF